MIKHVLAWLASRVNMLYLACWRVLITVLQYLYEAHIAVLDRVDRSYCKTSWESRLGAVLRARDLRADGWEGAAWRSVIPPTLHTKHQIIWDNKEFAYKALHYKEYM